MSKWRKRNRKSGHKPEEQTKPNLNDARKSYLEALDHTENATEEDHARCLGPNCPLLNGVLWEDFIELTDQSQKEEGIDGNDKKFKTLPRILNILKGLPWDKLISPPDPQTLRSHINDQLVKLAKGHRQDI